MRKLLVLVMCVATVTCIAQTTYSKKEVLMGVDFTFTAVHDVEETAQMAVEVGIEEVKRIEALISSWDPNSQTSAINNNAGISPVKVDAELFELIRRSKKISELSKGHFDISFASIHKVWDFENFNQKELPDSHELEQSVAKINYKDVILDQEGSTVFLKNKGMRIGFGAIGKGYAANRVKELMVKLGIEAGVVNAGGDLLSWGKKPDGSDWTVGISNPANDEEVMATLNVSDMAVVTSGNYKKFVEIDGKRYCHIINPKTGWPVENLASVTIVCPDAEFADALATTVFVLGKTEGLALVNHLEGIECMIIDDQGGILLSNTMNRQIIEEHAKK